MITQSIENTHTVQSCVSSVPALEGGAEKHDNLPKTSLHAFNLLQTDIGGDDLIATGDGDKDTCKVETGL